MVSAISGFYKTSTLKGNHISGCGTPASFSTLVLPMLPLMFYFPIYFTKFNIHFILYHSSHYWHNQHYLNLSKKLNKAYKFFIANDFFFLIKSGSNETKQKVLVGFLGHPYLCLWILIIGMNWKFLLSLRVTQRQFQFGFKWPCADKDIWANQNSLMCLWQINTNYVLEMTSVFVFSCVVSGWDFSSLSLQVEHHILTRGRRASSHLNVRWKKYIWNKTYFAVEQQTLFIRWVLY